jgi:uncharacterized protein with von Willebrand factor type A (vWA) domain
VYLLPCPRDDETTDQLEIHRRSTLFADDVRTLVEHISKQRPYHEDFTLLVENLTVSPKLSRQHTIPVAVQLGTFEIADGREVTTA